MNVKKLLLLLIFLTPVFGLKDTLAQFRIDLNLNSVLIKAFKDLIIVLVIILVSFRQINKGLFSKKMIRLIIVLLIITIPVFFLNSYNLTIAILGLRWVLPIFLMFFLISEDFNSVFFKQLSYILTFLIALNLIIQVFQLGLNLFRGANGVFTGPSTIGVFTIMAYYCIIYFSNFNKKQKLIVFVLATLSIFLSQSTLAILMFFIINLTPLFLSNRVNKFLKVFMVFFFIICSFFLYNNMDELSGRKENDSKRSLLIRKEILMDNLESSEIISTRFGDATNSAVNFKKQLSSGLNSSVKNSVIVDSMFISILINYGILVSIIFLLFSVILFIRVFRQKNNLELSLFLIILFLSMLTTIVTEVFPFNILFAIVGAFFIKNNTLNRSIN